MRSPSAHRKLASVSLQSVLAYRGNFLLGMLGPVFFLLTMLYLWRTLLEHGAESGFDYEQMKAYLIAAFICGSVVSMWTDFTIADRVLEGMVALDLTKPIDYQLARLAEALGILVFELVSALLAAAIVLAVFGGAPMPSGSQLALFAVSLLAVVPL